MNNETRSFVEASLGLVSSIIGTVRATQEFFAPANATSPKDLIISSAFIIVGSSLFLHSRRLVNRRTN